MTSLEAVFIIAVTLVLGMWFFIKVIIPRLPPPKGTSDGGTGFDGGSDGGD